MTLTSPRPAPVTTGPPGDVSERSHSRTVLMGLGLATLATVIWSGNFIIADAMAREIPPIQLAFWRWVIAMCAVAPFGVRHLRRDWAAVRAHWKFLAGAAVLGVTLFNTLIYTAGRTSPATNMALIAASSPLVITVGAHLAWKEPMGVRRWLGAALSLVGIVVLITRGSLAALLGLRFSSGDLVMVAAMFTFAIYSLMLRRKPAGISGLSLLLATFTLGTVFLSPAYVWSLSVQGGFPLHTTTVSALLYVGVLSSAVAFFSWNKAIATVGVRRASVIYYLEPAFVAVLAFLTLSEPINAPQGASMALIIVGVALSS